MRVKKQLQCIEFCFENVDSCMIKSEYINNFFMDEIKSRICAVNAYISHNSLELEHYKYCDHFTITIDKSANYTPYLDFGKFPSYRTLEDGTKAENSLFDRFMFNDICIVYLKYSDDTTEELTLCWNDVEYKEDINIYQKTIIEDNGDLRILISKD